MSKNPIAMKDLIEVKFKLLSDSENDKKSLITRTERYVCAVSNDVLSNSIQTVVLRTS
jgi:nitric oxide synthase-interacting protein